MTEQDEQRGDPKVGVCHVCGQEFDTQVALSKHLMDEHEEDVLDSDPSGVVEGGYMLAAVGGLSIVGILVVILVIVAIVWFARRA